MPGEWLTQQWIPGSRAETEHDKGEREIPYKGASLTGPVGHLEARFPGLPEKTDGTCVSQKHSLKRCPFLRRLPSPVGQGLPYELPTLLHLRIAHVGVA